MMNGASHNWLHYGYGGLFLGVFVDQIGVPFPAVLLLIAAGSLIASGSLNWVARLIVGVAAALIVDVIRYYIWKASGGRVLFFLRKLSLRPDTCVVRTTTSFSKNENVTLLFEKFIPVLGALVPPLAGVTSINEMRMPKAISKEVGVNGRGGHLYLTGKNSTQGGRR